jgi:hypothetical protein
VRDGEMSFKEESNSSRSEYTQFKSSTKKIADYIESDIRFKIPAFQRSYSWSGEDVIKLINDAVIRGDKGHFIGAFIVASDETGLSVIVDGQQRLTSILLAMCAIRDWKYKNHKICDVCKNRLKCKKCRENEKCNRHKNAYEVYVKCDACQDLKEIQMDENYKEMKKFINNRIINSNLDHEYTKNWETLFAGEERRGDWWELFNDINIRKNEQKNNMLLAYKKTYRYIETNSKKDEKFPDDVYSRIKELVFTEIYSRRPSDAYYVFRSLNSSGKPLAFNDHVKAHIFSYLDINENKEQIDSAGQSYTSDWNEIKNNVKFELDTKSLDTFTKNFAVVNLSRLDDFSDEYDMYFNAITDKEKAQECFKDMVKDSKIYHKIINPNINEIDKSRQKDDWVTQSNLKFLKDIGIKQHVQLVYSAYKCANSAELRDLTGFLAKFHFVYNELSTNRANRVTPKYTKYSKKFINLIELPKWSKSGHSSDVESKEKVSKIINDLKDDFNKILKDNPYIFEEAKRAYLELDYSDDTSLIGYVLHECFPKVSDETFEHVVPQATRVTNVDKAGNLIFLRKPDNSNDAKNLPVSEKFNFYNEYKYIPNDIKKIIHKYANSLTIDNKFGDKEFENNFTNFRDEMGGKIFEIFASDLGYKRKEFEEATTKSPARNVIEPLENPTRYLKSSEGLAYMIGDLYFAYNYGIQTGDFSYAKKYLSSHIEKFDSYTEIEELYKRDGWVVNGLYSYKLEDKLPSVEKSNRCEVKTDVTRGYMLYCGPDKKRCTVKKEHIAVLIFKCEYNDGYWKVLDVENK